VVVVRDSKLWFGGDDWFILLDRRVSPGPGQLGLFEPHNEHWSTVPILVFRGMESVFGVREYWPYVVLLVVVHLAIVVLLWHVMVRSAIDPWLALGVTAIVAVPGVGFENLTNVWQSAADLDRSRSGSARCCCFLNAGHWAGATASRRSC
jgi:hypothetical protein